MTEKPKCPNCGRGSIFGNKAYGNLHCCDCGCGWDESKRKPENVRTWELACKKLFSYQPETNRIWIHKDGFVAGDFDDVFGLGGCTVLMCKTEVDMFGWQDMPPMTRKDFAND